ncbi:GNAT family N-acetyltransferase [Limibaculum sp. M0105]|uniref:GNAT family N-acetyltransferase n=1 Tax=Thermohalobaculum xanthum TaxID=2753746 RepID=A0A8J7M919_9RHOB|nr:GNAT family N-acetyltransferase [Thermohalobaculum xanthum]MBK0400916.1 GNAT family N-acetyltransferase [Thermohalobaculum xanthum]
MSSEYVGSVEVNVLRTTGEVEQAREEWEAISSSSSGPTPHPWSDHGYFIERLARQPGFVRPHVLMLREGDARGLLPARIVEERVPWRVGGRRAMSSRARVLRVANGGLIGLTSQASAEAAVAALLAALSQGDADLVYLHELNEASALAAAARAAPGLSRDPCPRTAPSYTIDLPGTYEEFFRSRSANTRKAINRARNLTSRHLAEPIYVRYDSVDGLDRVMADCEAIAAGTYQREIGVGFHDDPQTRDFVEWALRRGWLHVHVLYDGARPVAFSHMLRYRGTLHLRDTGFDTDYANCRPGTALLANMIEEACASFVSERVDYGAMDADYKRQFSNERIGLVSMYLFSPSLRGQAMRAKRAATGAADRLARSVLGAELGRKLSRRIKALRR